MKITIIPDNFGKQQLPIFTKYFMEAGLSNREAALKTEQLEKSFLSQHIQAMAYIHHYKELDGYIDDIEEIFQLYLQLNQEASELGSAFENAISEITGIVFDKYGSH